MSKSFYELDYIIEISEKRLAEYPALYQKVPERLTNIILIYSALCIFLIPLTQHVLEADIFGIWFYSVFVFFAILFLTSLIYLVRLLLPAKIAYLDPPQKYYATFKSEIELLHLGNQQLVDDSLKGSYILELEDAITKSSNIFIKKSSFFYNALLFALLSIIPYVFCVGFHLAKKEHKLPQKIELQGKKS
jgi:hypothetical protein